MNLTFDMSGSCVGGNGPDLSRYPNLVHAVQQWGEGIRCHSNGAPIEPIATLALAQPIAMVAASHSVSVDEACDAFRYAKANGLV